MNKLFTYIGAAVLAIVMLGIPVLFVLSLVYSWFISVIVMLLALTICDVITLTVVLSMFAEYVD